MIREAMGYSGFCFERIRWCFLLLPVVWLAGCAPDDGIVVYRLGHGLNTQHPVHRGMEKLAEEVEARTNGEVRIRIFPNEQLGTERQSLELVQQGSLAMTKVSSAVMESFQDEYRVFGLPFLFDDGEHMWEALGGEIGREILESGRAAGLLGLCYYDAGARSFYTRERPIRSPEDLEGLRIRVQQSPMSIEMVRALGASPTPVPWGELYSSLQQGVVDGAENNPPSYHTANHYRVAPYFSLNEHLRLPDVLVIRPGLYDGLSEEHRAAFREAIEVSVAYQRELWKEAEEEALRVAREAGVEIVEFDDLGPFRERVHGIREGFEGTPVGELADRIRALRDQ